MVVINYEQRKRRRKRRGEGQHFPGRQSILLKILENFVSGHVCKGESDTELGET